MIKIIPEELNLTPKQLSIILSMFLLVGAFLGLFFMIFSPLTGFLIFIIFITLFVKERGYK
jgi:hypothetical protein